MQSVFCTMLDRLDFIGKVLESATLATVYSRTGRMQLFSLIVVQRPNLIIIEQRIEFIIVYLRIL